MPPVRATEHLVTPGLTCLPGGSSFVGYASVTAVVKLSTDTRERLLVALLSLYSFLLSTNIAKVPARGFLTKESFVMVWN